MSGDCTQCSNDCRWGEALCPECRDYAILHTLEKILAFLHGASDPATGAVVTMEVSPLTAPADINPRMGYWPGSRR